MQKGKISKILDAIIVRTAFGRLKANDRKSYKDHLFIEMLEHEGSLASQFLAARLQDWQLFQLKLRMQQLMVSSPVLETQSPEEFYRAYLNNLSELHAPEQVTSLHAIVDIAEDSATALSRTLALYDIATSELRGELLRYALLGDSNVPTVKPEKRELNVSKQHNVKTVTTTHTLEKFGHNMTAAARRGEIDPVIGRSKEIDRVIEILSRRKKNNPVLIGEAGVGKSAIAEALALRMAAGDVPHTLQGKQLFSLDISSLIAGTKFRGEFEERLQQLLEALGESKDAIIFIDEIHTIVGAGATQGSLDTANILKPALARGELQVIGATTLDEYRTDIESDAALERRFQKVIVSPTTAADTLEILRKISPHYQRHHRVKYTEEALQAIVSLSDRYISDRHFPDKAIDILDEAGARAHISASAQPRAAELAIAGDSSRAIEIAADDHIAEVDIKTIETVITDATGIPAERLSNSEQQRLQNLGHHLSQRVVGQDEAVMRLAQTISLSRAGLKDPRRPTGVFMFVGPTGVGKTLLAKELAQWMCNDSRGLIRIDMSEYAEKHNVSRLFGAPPGYVGYGDGGQLTEAVRRQPYAVVLLDEIEKAHSEVFNAMLQIFDEGHLTDGSGRKVDFRNTIIIMTSNIGSQAVATRRKAVGYTSKGSQEQETKLPSNEYQTAIERRFSPEFLNRVDNIILFKSLSIEGIKSIIELEINRLQQRVDKLGYTLRITPSAKQTLAEIGHSAKYGARSLKRTLSDKVEIPLSELIIAGHVSEGNTIVIEKSKSQQDVRLKVA